MGKLRTKGNLTTHEVKKHQVRMRKMEDEDLRCMKKWIKKKKIAALLRIVIMFSTSERHVYTTITLICSKRRRLFSIKRLLHVISEIKKILILNT